MPRPLRRLSLLALAPLLAACPLPSPPAADAGAVDAGAPGRVFVVIFTHVEDNTPGGTIPSPTSRAQYLDVRQQLLDTARAFRAHGHAWVFQPDWKLLLAALEFEDSSTRASTGGKNVLRYLREDLGVVVDPHSHEKSGYNYTDVAALLDQLGVGGSTVIGGHVWDPGLSQFAHWDRFRTAQPGSKYPAFSWRGDILMGHGTPNHVNDPTVSGVWRPRDPDHFFEDEPTGNITAVGDYTHEISGISTLLGLYDSGAVSPSCMLTSTYHLTPAQLANPAAVETDVLAPLDALVAGGRVVVTDFTSLVDTWNGPYGGSACIHRE
ncbi:MAG: hypothetical protein RL653_2055 [Pseudomonadota bacterium]|jgi:hypothetical protein